MGSSLTATAAQTVGPFFRDGMRLEQGAALFDRGTPGRRIQVQGRLFDGEGLPVADGIIEVWQCDARGGFGSAQPPNQTGLSNGFGRVYTDELGGYAFTTVMPGVPADGDSAAPYVSLLVFTRGLLRHVCTRMYFEGVEGNEGDGVLKSVPPERRSTLIALKLPQSDDAFGFDIRLGGAGETVFFSY